MSQDNITLATIVEVVDSFPHPNADKLDLTLVLGWQVVTGRNEYKKGDKAIYIQIDTVAPEKPEFEFLRNKQFRIKTQKFRGELSQGILFPLTILSDKEKNIGEDVTEEIGVIKYNKPIPASLGGITRGNFPTEIISKTDEERIQNVPNLINEFLGKDVYVSIKSDGCSSTYIHDLEGNFRVCSRNLEMKESDNTLWRLADKYELKAKLPIGFCIQAEVIGEGIQKNHEGIRGQDLRVFNVYNIASRKFLDYDNFVGFCNRLGVPTVDLYYIGPFKWSSVKKMLDEADKAKYKNGAQAEGLVWRLRKNEFNMKLRKDLSVKTVSNKYLLKHEEAEARSVSLPIEWYKFNEETLV